MNKIIRFIRDEEAATAVEYAVLLALIVAVAMTSINQMGGKTASAFSKFSNDMPN